MLPAVAGYLSDDTWEPTPLERLADEAGLDYWTLRDYLEAEVERRRTETPDKSAVGNDQPVP